MSVSERGVQGREGGEREQSERQDGDVSEDLMRFFGNVFLPPPRFKS